MVDSAPQSIEQTIETLDSAWVIAVIPALNEAPHIEQCIRSLMSGDPWLRQVLLIVADGGSTDGTVEIVRRLMPESSDLEFAPDTQ